MNAVGGVHFMALFSLKKDKNDTAGVRPQADAASGCLFSFWMRC